jgi:hypothetical protein
MSFSKLSKPLHIHVLVIPYSTTIRTLADAIRWAKRYFKCRGYVEGGPVEGKPGVFAWFFFPDPCYENQLSDELLVAYNDIKDGSKAKIYHGKPNNKGQRQYHHIVKSTNPYHRRETEPVDEELYALWDGSISFQEFLYERDPSLKDSLMLQFGSFEPFKPEP